jgi:tripartite-type tricarboxylate transporter receptor subunit TctC
MKHALKLILFGSLFTLFSAYAAERYPTKPVRLIMPYAPGAGSDIIARSLGQRLSESLGQTFVVDTRPGAAGLIGTEITAKAPADGYTLLLADGSHTINAVIYAKPRYDAVKDFAPISLVATTPFILLAHPSFGANSLAELLAMPKAQTEKIAMGTSGPGGTPYMTYEWLRIKMGLTLNEVPYKGGGAAMIDAVAGQIPLVLTSLAAGITNIKAGRLKGLGITTLKRHPLVPDVPTFHESGVKDFSVINWYGVLAPAGTPSEIVALLNHQIGRALEAPTVRDRLVTLALDVTPSSSDELLKYINVELKRWKDVMVETKAKLL